MARILNPKKTHKYPYSFKVVVVQLDAQPGMVAKNVANDLEIHPILLY